MNEMTSDYATAESGAGPTPSLIARVISVFTAPYQLGEKLRPLAPWFSTLLIVAILSAVVYVLVPTEVFEETIRQQIAANPRAAQQQGSPEQAVMFARYGGAVGILLFTFVAAAIIAGVMYLVINLVMGQDTTYKQHLSAVSHMYWIGFLGFLVLVPLWIARNDMQTTLSFGLLSPDAPSSFVGYFMNSVTIFGLWMSVALGSMESGLSGGRMSVGKAVGTVIVLYLVWGVLSAVRRTAFGF